MLKLGVGGFGGLLLELGLRDVWQAVGALGGAAGALQPLCNACNSQLGIVQTSHQAACMTI